MKYGILDTQDNTWLGDDGGPKLFDKFWTARIAAQVWEMQCFGTDQGARFKAQEFEMGQLHKKDEIPIRMSGAKAIQRIEGRTQ